MTGSHSSARVAKSGRPSGHRATNIPLDQNGEFTLHTLCRPCPLILLSSARSLFLPILFLGTASGQFLRPAASRLLLSRFLPNGTGPSHKAPTRLGSSGLSLSGAPGKWGKKKEKKFMSYLYVKWNSFGGGFSV